MLRKDVIFEEEKQWDWDKTQTVPDLEWHDDENERNIDGETGEIHDERVKLEEDASSDGEDIISRQRQSRIRHPPTWMGYYINGEGLSEDETNMA